MGCQGCFWFLAGGLGVGGLRDHKGCSLPRIVRRNHSWQAIYALTPRLPGLQLPGALVMNSIRRNCNAVLY